MTKLERQCKKIDSIAELNNQLVEIIGKSKLSLSDVVLVLSMLIDDCKENFRMQIKLRQVN